MGLFDRFRGKIIPPKFTVGIFGKLPCYKEYFFVSCHPAFSQLKSYLDDGFDRLIRSGSPRPYIRPDRRLYIDMPEAKAGLVACIWESDDGLRGFPFIMAVALPSKMSNQPFPAFWQLLERIWQYLEAFYKDLKDQRESSSVYNRVRGIVHQIPPFKPEPWQTGLMDSTLGQRVVRDTEKDIARILMDGLDPRGEQDLIRNLSPTPNPGLIIWPEPGWRDRKAEGVAAFLSTGGMGRLDLAFFRSRPEDMWPAPADPVEEPPLVPEARESESDDPNQLPAPEKGAETPSDTSYPQQEKDRDSGSGEESLVKPGQDALPRENPDDGLEDTVSIPQEPETDLAIESPARETTASGHKSLTRGNPLETAIEPESVLLEETDEWPGNQDNRAPDRKNLHMVSEHVEAPDERPTDAVSHSPEPDPARPPQPEELREKENATDVEPGEAPQCSNNS